MDKAAGTTPENLKKLGIEIGKNAQGGYDAEQTFLNVVTAFNATDDAARKAAIGSTAFGKGWQTTVKLLDQGTESLKKSFGEVQNFEIFSDKDLQKSEDYRKSMHELDIAVKGLERQLGEALVPTLTKAAKEFAGMVEEIDKMGKPIGDLLSHFGGIDAAFKALTNPAGLAIDNFKKLGGAISDFFSSGDSNGDLIKSIDAFYHKQDDASRAIDDAAVKTKEAALATATHTSRWTRRPRRQRLISRSNQGLRQALDDARIATEKATKATHDYFDATSTAMGGDISLEAASLQ